MSEQATKLPDNHVLAVMPSQNASKSAMSDLERSGFTENTVMRGEAVAREVDAKGDNSGPVGKVVKALADHMSEQQNYLAQYEERGAQRQCCTGGARQGPGRGRGREGDTGAL